MDVLRRTKFLATSLAVVFVASGCSSILPTDDLGPLDDIVDVSDCTSISSNIEDDETWDQECYELDGRVRVESQLTIEPGVVIQANQDAGLQIQSSGSLIAEGTEDNPIRFTGSDGQPGWWDGIFFNDSTHIDNSIDHIVVEHAGASSMGTRTTRDGTQAAGLTLGQRGRDAEVSITNSTFRDNDGHGVFVHSSAQLEEFSSNTLESNESPLSLRAPHIDAVDGGTETSGNEEEFITVRGGDTSGDTTWRNFGTPWRVSSGVEVADGTTTIEAGTELHFEDETRLQIEATGALSVEGTDDEPVLFTATTETPGWWDGVFFNDTTLPDNSIEHAIFEYAAANSLGDRTTRDGTQPAAVCLGQRGRDANVDITDSVFRHNDGHGIFAHSSSTIEEFGSNTFENNERPVSIRAHHIDAIDEDSTYEDNDTDVLVVRGGGISEDTNWNNPGVPWRLKGNIDIDDGTTQIHSGNRIEVDYDGDGVRLRVEGAGALNVDGADEEVHFYGTQETPGWWVGIFINDSDHPNNRIENAVIQHAGESSPGTRTRDQTQPGGLVVGQRGRSGEIDVYDSEFSDNDGYGVFVHSSGSTNEDICSENTFSSNGDDDCRID